MKINTLQSISLRRGTFHIQKVIINVVIVNVKQKQAIDNQHSWSIDEVNISETQSIHLKSIFLQSISLQRWRTSDVNIPILKGQSCKILIPFYDTGLGMSMNLSSFNIVQRTRSCDIRSKTTFFARPG
jgi:hypothetical protein